MPLQHKLQTESHSVTLAVGSTRLLATLQRFFETVASCSPRLQHVTCLLRPEMDYFSNFARQVARKIVSCNTSLTQCFMNYLLERNNKEISAFLRDRQLNISHSASFSFNIIQHYPTTKNNDSDKDVLL